MSCMGQGIIDELLLDPFLDVLPTPLDGGTLDDVWEELVPEFDCFSAPSLVVGPASARAHVQRTDDDGTVRADCPPRSPGAAQRQALRRERKRLCQRSYRARDRKEREQALSRIKELEVMLDQLSLRNSWLKLKDQALTKFGEFMDRLLDGLAGRESHPALQHPTYGWIGRAETAQDMTVPRFAEAWRFIVSESGKLLMKLEAGCPEAKREMATGSLLVEQLLFNCAALHPGMEGATLCKLDTGEPGEPSPEFCLQAVRAIHLSDEQMGQLVNMADILGATHQMEQLDAMMARLQHELASLTDQDAQHLQSLQASTSEHSLASSEPLQSYRNPGQVLELLKGMVKRKNMLKLVVSSFVINTVMTTEQKYLINISSWPYILHYTNFMAAVRKLQHERQQGKLAGRAAVA